MTKLLHTADLHLDSPLVTLALRDDGLRAAVENATRDALYRIVDIAIAEEVAAVLIAGDLYDGSQRSMKTAAFLLEAFRRLADEGIRVFLIRGNHDAESTITREIAWPDNVHVFDGHGGHVMLTDGIAIHGVSFREPRAPDSLVAKFRPVGGVMNIALLHTSLGGAEGHDPYAPCMVSDLIAAGFDYWALGHIHRRTVHHTAPFVVMPGMPQGRDMGEDGPKSATLIHVDAEGIRIEERRTAALEFRRESFDISDCAGMSDVHARIAALVRGLSDATPVVLRLTLTGQSGLNWQLRRDADLVRDLAVEAAAATGSIWIDRVEIATRPPGAHGPTDTATDEIAGLISEAAMAPGLPAEATAILSAVLSDVPAELRDHFAPDEATMEDTVGRLIDDASDWAIAQMHATRDA
jgi:exonuclease SbcD